MIVGRNRDGVLPGYVKCNEAAAALVEYVIQVIGRTVFLQFVRLTVLVDDLLYGGLLVKDEVAGENNIFQSAIETNVWNVLNPFIFSFLLISKYSFHVSLEIDGGIQRRFAAVHFCHHKFNAVLTAGFG